MKTNRIINIVMLLFIGCWVLTPTYADASNYQKKNRTRLKAYYEKLSNNDKKISIILTQGSGKSMSVVQNAEIFLTTDHYEEEIDLTSLFTDDNGEAILIIESGYKFVKDEEGYSIINVSYKGNDSLRAAENQIKFKDLYVDITFDIIDSINYVTVSAYEMDSVGNEIPIEGVELNVGVERLYSTLNLEEIETDEEGTGRMEFPKDIPGDSTGAIKVMVTVNEHDDYGTITKSATINWGTLVDYSIALNGRSLFGDEAPLWMIISVFVILIGAWYHFILATFKVIKIKNTDKNYIEIKRELSDQ